MSGVRLIGLLPRRETLRPHELQAIQRLCRMGGVAGGHHRLSPDHRTDRQLLGLRGVHRFGLQARGRTPPWRSDVHADRAPLCDVRSSGLCGHGGQRDERDGELVHHPLPVLEHHPPGAEVEHDALDRRPDGADVRPAPCHPRQWGRGGLGLRVQRQLLVQCRRG